MKRIATLEEIDRHWTLEDLADANEAQDALEEAQAEAAKPKEKPPGKV